MEINCGEIWWVDFGGSKGHEYQKTRPVLVIESNQQLKITTVITIIPLTHQKKNQHKDDVVILRDSRNNLIYDSVLKMHHILSFDRSRFKKRIGRVDEEILVQVKRYLKRHFGIE